MIDFYPNIFYDVRSHFNYFVPFILYHSFLIILCSYIGTMYPIIE